MITITPQVLVRDPPGLLARVRAGENLLIGSEGELPAVELRAVAPVRKVPRPIGICAGEFTVSDHFDDPLPEEILRDFEGR